MYCDCLPLDDERAWLNRCVVCVKLIYAIEATCDLRQ
jgi:hypothetical protein